jgi:hypothetical protein
MGNVEGQGRMGDCEMDGDNKNLAIKFKSATED